MRIDLHDEEEDPVYKKIRQRFGYSYLYPAQIMIISMLLEASGYYGPEREAEAPNKLIAVLPTGSGKSACFMVPILFSTCLSVVVYPLKALISDQLKRFQKAGIPAAVFHGGLTENQRRMSLSALKEGNLKAVLVNPEAFKNREFFQLLSVRTIAHVFIDEAHTVSEWGDSFRPACREMAEHIRLLKPRTITALTATAGGETHARIKSILFDDAWVFTLFGNPDKPNIHYSIHHTLAKNQSLRYLLERAALPAIIFCNSRVSTEIIALMLKHHMKNHEVFFYHAGLSEQEKHEVEHAFAASHQGILAATCAFGLGVDISHIRTIIHYTLPPTPEAYLQETGRAGRDKEKAWAVALLSPDDLRSLTNKTSVRMQRLVRLFAKGGCRRSAVLSLFGQHDNVCSGCDVCDRITCNEPGHYTDFLRWYFFMRRAVPRNSIVRFLFKNDCVTKSHPLLPIPPQRFSEKGDAEEAEKNLGIITGVCRQKPFDLFPSLFLPAYQDFLLRYFS